MQLPRMVFRPLTGNWLAVLRNGFGGGKCAYTTSTAHYRYGGQEQQHRKKDFVAIYVAIGMIALSTGLGVHTAWQQLRNSPTVRVKKQRRETVPEVVEPEHVAEESEKLMKQSFFRKVAHVQDRSYPDDHQIPNPITRDVYAYTPHIHTLKSVGVDPSSSPSHA